MMDLFGADTLFRHNMNTSTLEKELRSALLEQMRYLDKLMSNPNRVLLCIDIDGQGPRMGG